MVPVRGFSGELFGLQFIDENGSKKFLTGTVKKGHFHLIGEVVDTSGYMAIVEGYATGVSIRLAFPVWPVFVAFDAGNLLEVSKVVRGQYPHAKIVICGDEDFDNPDNPGRTKAELAADAVDGVAVFPPLKEVSNG